MARLLLVAQRYPPDSHTGRAAAFARLARRLSREHETRLVVGWRRDRSLVPDDALAVDLRGPLPTGLELWRAIREEGRRLRPDLVIASGLQLPPVRWPAVAVVRDLVETGWLPGHVGRWTRLRARSLAGVVVPSQSVRRSVVGLGVDRWRIHRIPDGLDVPAEPAPVPPEGPVLRLVHPGRIHPAKRQHVSIDAVARLPPGARGRVHLVIAGHVADPRYLDQLRVAARDHPVTLRPAVPDLEAELRKAHLVLYPTALDEGFPDTAVEAMALGRAVLFSDRAPLREATGGHGLRVPGHDVEAIRARILDALAGRVGLETLGARAHRWARDTYGWDTVWPRWRSLLTGLLR